WSLAPFRHSVTLTVVSASASVAGRGTDCDGLAITLVVVRSVGTLKEPQAFLIMLTGGVAHCGVAIVHLAQRISPFVSFLAVAVSALPVGVMHDAIHADPKSHVLVSDTHCVAFLWSR